MKCVDWDITKKVKFENPPPSSETGNPRKVIWITRRQKCSDFQDQLRLKEGEEDVEIMEEEILLIDAEEDSVENEEVVAMEAIREHFKRFLKCAVI